MDLSQLRLLASGLSAPSSSLSEIAFACHDLTEVKLDVRFHVLEDCCRLLAATFGGDEGFPVASAFYDGADALVRDRLNDILDEPSDELAVVLAQAFRTELRALLNAEPPHRA